MTNVRRRLSAFVVVAALAWPQAAQAEVRLESVYSFPWPDPVNAQFPNAITLGSDGKLYGTAQGGPAPPFYGVIYSMTTSGVFTLLHALKESEGVNPGPLVEASDGNLYGVAQEGGGCGAGWGTVFRISKTGSFKTVHSFGCPGDGARPTGALVLGADQHLYGLTEGGGTWNQGTLFRLSLSGQEVVLHSFRGTLDSPIVDPVPRSITLARDGNFYGISAYGGAAVRVTTSGEVSLIDTPWIPLYGGSTLVQASDGNLYGTSWGGPLGQGTAFRISTDGTATVIRNFQTWVDGGYPGGVVQGSDGFLYGSSGLYSTFLFRMSTDGNLAVISSFQEYAGRFLLNAPLAEAADGYFYAASLGNYCGSTNCLGSIVRFRIPTVKMSLDAPQSNRFVYQPFLVTGWAISEANATGTGVAAVHVWAYPESGSPVFLGAASYGRSRPDVGAIFGSRFEPSGFSLVPPVLTPGNYRIVAFVQSAVTGAFDATQTAAITVGAVQSAPRVQIDLPGPAAVVGPSFVVAGWAIDAWSPDSAGVDAVHVWAYPAGGAAPVFLGAATLGVLRQDVAAVYGPQFANSGYGLGVGTLPPGAYQLVVFARSSITGTFTPQIQNITVRPPGSPQMALDTPAPSAIVMQPFGISGWALDADAAAGTGVNAIHVWAFPSSGAPPLFLGAAAYGWNRPDVGAIFGTQFTPSGYSLQVSSLPPGQYQIVAFARSTVTSTFNQARTVTVTVF